MLHIAEKGIFSCFGNQKAALLRKGTNLKTCTINVRIAGIDAPEIGKNGEESQPFAEKAKEKLKNLVDGKTVVVELQSRDQYGRAIGIVKVPYLWVLERDIAPDLLKTGLAVVYKGAGSCFGSHENKMLYCRKEQSARAKKKGIWSQKLIETPAEYKRSRKDLIK